MPIKRRWEVNPFESPIDTRSSSRSTTTPDAGTEEPDILTTADLLLEQLKELEILCSTIEERVQRKRKALKELEYLILGPNSPEGSPYSPVCPANTPISPRSHLVSPRLRGLFDLRGPGQANLDAIQSCLDYSPDPRTVVIPTREEFGLSEDWVDDDDALSLGSPFDDKYALRQSPHKIEKKLPPIPREELGEVLGSKIPRKVYVRRKVSTSRKVTRRPSSTVARSSSHRHRTTMRNGKTTSGGSDLPTKEMRRDSYRRNALENAKVKGGAKGLSTNENENENENEKGRARRKEKRKGLRSIYSVCSEFGLSGTPRAI